MGAVYPDPIHGMLSIVRGRGYAMTDLLNQSIACATVQFVRRTLRQLSAIV